MRWTTSILVLACAACADGTRPDDMGAAEHRSAAAGAEEEAAEHEGDYDPNAERRPEHRGTEMDVIYGTDRYNPTERHRELAAEYRDLARRHRQAAEELEAFEEAECAMFPASTRASCPLLGQLASTEDVPLGIRLVFREDVDSEAVYAHIRCHLAFARRRGRQESSHCPLFLSGVGVDRDLSGATVLQVDDPDDVERLRAAVRAHIVH